MHNSLQRGPTLDHVWITAAVVLILLGPLIAPVPPNDLWFHVATGRQTLTSGVIPLTDSFSYTRYGAPFFNQAWLAQIALFALDQAGGVPLLLLVHATTLLLAYGLLLRLCIRRSGHLRLSIALFIVTLPIAFPDWNIRPQTFAFPLFVGFLYVLTAYRLGWFNRLWLLPLLMLLWVNMHGTFPLGIALIGATWLGMLFRRRPTTDDRRPTEGLRPLLLWGAITALAMLANPRGWGVLAYVRNLVGNNAVTSLVTEWAAPTTREPAGAIFFLFLIASGLVLIYARRKPDLADMLMALPLLWLSLGASRNTVWFAFVAVPLLIVQAATLAGPPGRAARGAPLINGVLIGMLGLAVVACLPWVKPLWLDGAQGALLKNTPVAAVAWLERQPNRPAHLFHSEAHGSYLTYAAPDQPVFIDPRIELYPYQQWADYIDLSAGERVAPLVAKYGIDGMLLSRQSQQPLIDVLHGDPAWAQQYQDALVVYFARR